MKQRFVGITQTIVFGLAVFYVVGMAWSAKGFDFRAYYCAGVAARSGQNPYHTEPLRTCERTRTDAQMAGFARETVLPAPFPGYAIALVEPLSVLPFRFALAVWTLVLVSSIWMSGLLLHRVTKLDPALIFAALALCVGLPSLGLGEVMPIVFGAVVLCARAAQAGRWQLAAVAAGTTLIEPHIGLPVFLSLAIWAPRTRVMLAAIALIAMTVSVVALGFAANVEYLTRVLPYHALAEIGADSQLSLAAVLHAFHVNDSTAIAAGAASYAAMLALGILLGRRLASFYRNGAFLVLTPPALAVIGGAFVHVTQTAVAVPFVLMLMAAEPKYRRVFAVAVVLLCVPWVWLGSINPSIFEYVLVSYIALEALPGDAVFGSGLAILAIALLLTLSSAQLRSSGTQQNVQTVTISSEYAEGDWARENSRYLSTDTIGSWLRRAPTWAGLLLASCGAVLATLPQRGLSRHAA